MHPASGFSIVCLLVSRLTGMGNPLLINDGLAARLSFNIARGSHTAVTQDKGIILIPLVPEGK